VRACPHDVIQITWQMNRPGFSGYNMLVKGQSLPRRIMMIETTYSPKIDELKDRGTRMCFGRRFSPRHERGQRWSEQEPICEIWLNAELLDYYAKINPDDLDKAVKRAVSVNKPLPPGSLAALLYMFDKKNAEATARFAQDLADRRGGALKLIKKLTDLRKQSMGRVHEAQVNALIIQAWSAYRAGESVTDNLATC
jgi:hypothetical protein